ncbi:hypothetical protein DFP93_11811 [Aneurinibacillus soli]|uniref:Uncharacterized protein n=1 Tax=Aneurinibacillus soli TaxID=1500254 RepID=A0A0U4WD56_9BACL|nr:hypothetical protein [Aneurinibacillus soli]PYE59263.1 hypothetical protein DFP93_11811 [Aneurinibacillus soli]BAU26747.1 hypothetical protein CB4_00890 [Aneurinibacillus soli]
MIWFLLFIVFLIHFVVTMRNLKRQKERKELIVFSVISILAISIIAAHLLLDIPPLMNYLFHWMGPLSERLTFSLFGIKLQGGS